MDDLIARLRERAADPKRRTDAPQSVMLAGPGGTLTTQFGGFDALLAPYGDAGSTADGGSPGGASPGGASPGSGGMLGALLGDLQRVVDANRAGRPIDAGIAGRVDAMSAALSTDSTTELPPPASPEALDAAERRLGFALPPPLRRVWAEVADGGFGPGGGLVSADRAVHEYLALTALPQGPRDQPWPPELLPVGILDPGYDCIDVRTGRIVAWDPEELTERSGDRAWQASFSEIASSLEAYLDDWVGSRPEHEVMQEQLESSMVRQATESRAMIAAMTPEERAAMGLPEVGWEEVVWGGLGLEPDADRGA